MNNWQENSLKVLKVVAKIKNLLMKGGPRFICKYHSPSSGFSGSTGSGVGSTGVSSTSGAE
jgi:hypothetical protein